MKDAAAQQQASDLNPGRANPHLGAVLNFVDKYEDAIQPLNKGIRLDPKGPGYYFLWLGHAYFGLDQYEKAIAEYRKALDRQPDYLFAHILLAATFGLTGHEADAQNEAAAVIRIDPKFSVDNFANRLS